MNAFVKAKPLHTLRAVLSDTDSFLLSISSNSSSLISLFSWRHFVRLITCWVCMNIFNKSIHFINSPSKCVRSQPHSTQTPFHVVSTNQYTKRTQMSEGGTYVTGGHTFESCFLKSMIAMWPCSSTSTYLVTPFRISAIWTYTPASSHCSLKRRRWMNRQQIRK